MNGKRFNELLSGALFHPVAEFTCARLELALAHVVERCGKQAEEALEEWCAEREARDQETDD